MKNKSEANGFDNLGIAPRILDVLKDLHYNTPTPIQRQSIPTSLEGKDLVGIAQTGTGKTLAFGIPMIERLARYKGRGLVILPTRELAIQVDESLRAIGTKLGLRTAVLIGGEPISKQLRAIKAKPHIIVATPGRLIDHAENRSVDLSDVRILVLDEADMMLDMGFLPQIKKVLNMVPVKRQTMLFSATMPDDIVSIASHYMSLPIRIEVAKAGTSAENVDQELFVVDKTAKFDNLSKLLDKNRGSVLIFLRTKHTVRSLTKKLNLIGHKAAEIHSNRSLSQRQEALAGFKSGKYRILIATDIAARGIDVNGISLVINYDLPDKSGDYVHRIGRTGRAGQTGRAISFVLPSQIKNVQEIEKLIRKKLKIDRSASELAIISREAAKLEREEKAMGKNEGSSNSFRRSSSFHNKTNSNQGRKPIRKVVPAGRVFHASNNRPATPNRSPRPSQITPLDLADIFPNTSDPLAPSKKQFPARRPQANRTQVENSRPLSTLTDRERFRRSMRSSR